MGVLPYLVFRYRVLWHVCAKEVLFCFFCVSCAEKLDFSAILLYNNKMREFFVFSEG